VGGFQPAWPTGWASDVDFMQSSEIDVNMTSWASASLHLGASSWAAPGCHDGFASATARA